MTMKVEIIDELLKDCKIQEDVFGENGIFVKCQLTLQVATTNIADEKLLLYRCYFYL